MHTNNFVKTGRILFALAFIMGGLLHLTGPAFTATMVPGFFGAPYFWVYFTGVAQLAFATSALLKKHDQLAALLLALMMLVFIATIHLPTAAGGEFMGVIGFMRDLGYTGAALLYAGAVAQHRIFKGADAKIQHQPDNA